MTLFLKLLVFFSLAHYKVQLSRDKRNNCSGKNEQKSTLSHDCTYTCEHIYYVYRPIDRHMYTHSLFALSRVFCLFICLFVWLFILVCFGFIGKYCTLDTMVFVILLIKAHIHNHRTSIQPQKKIAFNRKREGTKQYCLNYYDYIIMNNKMS